VGAVVVQVKKSFLYDDCLSLGVLLPFCYLFLFCSPSWLFLFDHIDIIHSGVLSEWVLMLIAVIRVSKCECHSAVNLPRYSIVVSK